MKMVIEFDMEDSKIDLFKKDIERLIGVLEVGELTNRLWGAPFDLRDFLTITYNILAENDDES